MIFKVRVGLVSIGNERTVVLVVIELIGIAVNAVVCGDDLMSVCRHHCGAERIGYGN